MALVAMNSEGDCGSKVIGVKLEVSPLIVPRDKSVGTKLFTLVPKESKTVRDFKSHIANNLLKTPAPFHVFVGEYRISDDEGVEIFSIITEPCRLLPVPLPPSALSSTPQLKVLPDKRVTFFGHLTSSPVPVVEVEPDQNGQDVQDGRSGQTLSRNIPSPQQLMIASSTDAAASPKSVCLDESSPERKKRRRRKRSKKSKPSKAKDLSGDGDSSSYKGDNETETSRSNGMTPTNGSNGSFHTPVQSGSKRIRRNVKELNEDTESEDETTGQATSDFNFVAPTKLPVKRPRLNGNTSSNGKVDNVSDSAFDTFENYYTTPPASESSSSFKTRQDTPIVPRVTKNLSVFNSARKIIADFSATAHDDVHAQAANISAIPTTSKSEIRDPEFYTKLDTILSGDVVKTGDLIAFKVLELDERYNPSVSDFKEGIVIDKVGKLLSISFTKNQEVLRNGKYELQDDSEPDCKPAISILNFDELMEPKLISKQNGLPNVDNNRELCTD